MPLTKQEVLAVALKDREGVTATADESADDEGGPRTPVDPATTRSTDAAVLRAAASQNLQQIWNQGTLLTATCQAIRVPSKSTPKSVARGRFVTLNAEALLLCPETQDINMSGGAFMPFDGNVQLSSKTDGTLLQVVITSVQPPGPDGWKGASAEAKYKFKVNVRYVADAGAASVDGK